MNLCINCCQKSSADQHTSYSIHKGSKKEETLEKITPAAFSNPMSNIITLKYIPFSNPFLCHLIFHRLFHLPARGAESERSYE